MAEKVVIFGVPGKNGCFLHYLKGATRKIPISQLSDGIMELNLKGIQISELELSEIFEACFQDKELLNLGIKTIQYEADGAMVFVEMVDGKLSFVEILNKEESSIKKNEENTYRTDDEICIELFEKLLQEPEFQEIMQIVKEVQEMMKEHQ